MEKLAKSSFFEKAQANMIKNQKKPNLDVIKNSALEKQFEYEAVLGEENPEINDNDVIDKDVENQILKTDNYGTNNKQKKGFRAFNLNEELLNAIFKLGYKYPTPIQRRVIPEALNGFNIIANSRTGSGKTAAFLLPIIQKLVEHSNIVGARCLILSPTRELALQTLDFCKKFSKSTNLRFALVVGGNQLEGQFEKLAQNPDIIIATPGRVTHHLVSYLI